MSPILLIMWTAFQSFILRHNNNNNNINNNNNNNNDNDNDKKHSKYLSTFDKKKHLRGGESNPGLPRDRRGYSPLYYRGIECGGLNNLPRLFPIM